MRLVVGLMTILSPDSGGRLLLESYYLCRSRRRVVVVVGSVLSFFVGVGLQDAYPLCCFLLIFCHGFGSMGPPDAFLFLFSVRRFSPPFKIRKSAEFSQDTGIGCGLKGTKKNSICTLFLEHVSASYSKCGSALKIAP